MDGDDELEYARLMQLAREQLPGYMEEVLESDTEKLYSQINCDIQNTHLLAKTFDEEVLRLLLRTFQDDRFLRSDSGWPLLMVFDYDWRLLSRTQKTELLKVLSDVFPKYQDWMPCFTISEFVGEKYTARQSFDFFYQFKSSANENARQFVPHGLEHALQNSPSAKLTKQIWQALLQMKQDSSEAVRGEVDESLGRLEYHGLQPPSHFV